MSIRGMGIFLQGLKPMRETPQQAAKLCVDNGVKFVGIYGVQQGRRGLEGIDGKPGRIDTYDTMQRYADAFRKAKIDMVLWGYPHCGREGEFVAEMAAVDKIIKPSAWCLDPEVSYKGDRNGERLIELGRLALDSGKSRRDVGITSYGLPSMHKTFPWKALGGDNPLQGISWGCPQLYLPEIVNAAEANKLVDRGMAEWSGAPICFIQNLIPAVPAFGKNSGGRMHDFLSMFIDQEQHQNLVGMFVWSWPSIDKTEWATIKRWAGWFKSGAVGV